MKKLALEVVVLCIASASLGQTPYSAQAYINARDKVATIQRKYPYITIAGEVKDHTTNADGDTVIQVWGRTVGCDYGKAEGCNSPRDEFNIVVINPVYNGGSPGVYYTGNAQFIRRESGTNGFGATIPIFVYGDRPELRAAKAEVKRLEAAAAKAGLDPATGVSLAEKQAQDQAALATAEAERAAWTAAHTAAKNDEKEKAAKVTSTGTIFKCQRSPSGMVITVKAPDSTFDVVIKDEEVAKMSSRPATMCSENGQKFVVVSYQCGMALPCLASITEVK